jgi:hypothetical protein
MRFPSRQLLSALITVAGLTSSWNHLELHLQNASPTEVDQNLGPHAECGVQQTDISILSRPGSATVIGSAKCGEDLTILNDEVGFYKVQTRDGKKGYVSRLFVANADQDRRAPNGNPATTPYPGNGVGFPDCQFCPDPGYTPEARAAKYQGMIILEVIITAEGKLSSIRAVQVRTLDNKNVDIIPLDLAWVSLEETSIDTVRRWRFKPASGPGGTPVDVRVPIQITFRLVQLT